MNLKQPLTYDQQIEKLRQHNIIVNDSEAVKRLLKEISYYRLSGYALQYRISENNSDCVDGTTIEKILELYSFDCELRQLLREYVEIAEIYIRSQIAYNFSINHCINPPHDQHYDESLYGKAAWFQSVLENFSRQKSYYKDSAIMKHHVSHYGGKLPLWAITEMISLSDLSKLYSSMRDEDQNKIAIVFHTGRSILRNNLHCLSILRNKCAHAARLYNTVNNPPVKFDNTTLRTFPELKGNTLFAFIVVLMQLLPNKIQKDNMRKELLDLFARHKSVIDPRLIGLCSDYETILASASR